MMVLFGDEELLSSEGWSRDDILGNMCDVVGAGEGCRVAGEVKDAGAGRQESKGIVGGIVECEDPEVGSWEELVSGVVISVSGNHYVMDGDCP